MTGFRLAGQHQLECLDAGIGIGRMTQTANGNEVLDFDPRKLPEKHLTAIGLMSAAASSTDSIIEMAIAGMLGVDGEQGYAVTAHMSAPLRASGLKASAEIALTSAAALDELDVVLGRIATAAKERNDFVHGSWCFRESDGAVLLIQQEARTHVEVKSRPVKAEEIREKAAALYEAGLGLMRFLMAVDMLPALPRDDRVRGVNTPKARKLARRAREKAKLSS